MEGSTDSWFTLNADRDVRVGDHVAVYGEYLTLFNQNTGAPELRGTARLVGACWLSGSLYAVEENAGIVPERPGEVLGELYEILDVGCIEWCDAKVKADCERTSTRFERRYVEQIEPELPAWAYTWAHSEIASGRAIPTGDWRGHLDNRAVRSNSPADQ